MNVIFTFAKEGTKLWLKVSLILPQVTLQYTDMDLKSREGKRYAQGPTGSPGIITSYWFSCYGKTFFFFNLRHLYLHKGISESRMIIWQGSDVT